MIWIPLAACPTVLIYAMLRCYLRARAAVGSAAGRLAKIECKALSRVPRHVCAATHSCLETKATQLVPGVMTKMSRQEALKAGPVTQCRAYVMYKESDAATWKNALKSSEDAPNAQQDVFLQSVNRRCEVERLELNKSGAHCAQSSSPIMSEPARLCLLGIPGAGKNIASSSYAASSRNVWHGRMACDSNFSRHRTPWLLSLVVKPFIRGARFQSMPTMRRARVAKVTLTLYTKMHCPCGGSF